MKHQKVLLIDHNDSFTFNLVHLFNEVGGCKIDVMYYSNITIETIQKFDKIVLGPGPGIPDEYPHFKIIFSKFIGKKPILGICLGHQAIVQHFGASLINLPKVLHGEKAKIEHQNHPIFKNVPSPFFGGLYHSWAVDTKTLPTALHSIAHYGKINMGIAHHRQAVYGLQFHPESYMTPYGKTIVTNWLNL